MVARARLVSTDNALSSSPTALLMDLPMDVCLEIFSYLSPTDVFRLSRTSHLLRDNLMCRSAMPIWKAALKNTPGPDFPPCPDDMAPSAWIALVYGEYCNLCGMLWRPVKPDFMLRLRLCSHCRNKELKSLDQMRRNEGDEETCTVRKVWSLTPTTVRTVRKIHVESACLPRDYEAVKAELSSQSDENAYLSSQYEYLARRALSARSADDWLREKHRAERIEHEAHESAKKLQVEKWRKEREVAVWKRLEELGFDEPWVKDTELYKQHECLDIEPSGPFTETDWRLIKDKMVEFLAEQRSHRLKKERLLFVDQRMAVVLHTVLRPFKRELLTSENVGLGLVFPNITDVCEFPPIHEMLNLPTNEHVDAGRLTDVLPQMPELYDRWLEQIRDELAKVIRGSVSLKQFSEVPDLLRQTSRVMVCEHFMCRDIPLFYPEVLTHRCNSLDAELGNLEIYDGCETIIVGGKPASSARGRLAHSFRRTHPWVGRRIRRPWSADNLVKSKKMQRIVKEVVARAGLDPATATVEAMDKFEGYFACPETCCPRKKHVYKVRGWRKYVSHIHAQSSSLSSNEDDLILPSQIKDKKCCKILSTEVDERYWNCLHCADGPTEGLPQSLTAVKSHLNETHSELLQGDARYGIDFVPEAFIPPAMARTTLEIRRTHSIAKT
ncbi:hypothetical protein BDZ89DRAFT_1109607 [Hymenopellis radicata]|nr:hypothetical protein BDZ89DRAFT_1109607 [Hymenopellis radicata]